MEWDWKFDRNLFGLLVVSRGLSKNWIVKDVINNERIRGKLRAIRLKYIEENNKQISKIF